MNEKELKKLITTPYEDIQEQQERAEYYQERERKNAELCKAWWWAFWIGIMIMFWYFAIVGVIHSIQPT